jgi:hypothetical protein
LGRQQFIAAAGLLFWFLRLGALGAQPIFVPNASFERPDIFYADPRMNVWTKAPKPPDYVEGGGFLWDQLAGSFDNPQPSSRDHIVNCDGAQAAYLFAVPGAGFFQDHLSNSTNSTATANERFDIRFEAGKSYRLTAGYVGRGGDMRDGVPLEMSLFYRDASSNIVTAAATVVLNNSQDWPDSTLVITNNDGSTSSFIVPVRTNLVDYSVELPTVRPGDPWAGKHIGIRFLSTVSDEMKGGYWDIDNVRLVATLDVPPIASLQIVGGEEGVRISWASVTGYRYQLRRSADLGSWTDAGDPITGTGDELVVTIPVTDTGFFNVVAVPTP